MAAAHDSGVETSNDSNDFWQGTSAQSNNITRDDLHLLNCSIVAHGPPTASAPIPIGSSGGGPLSNSSQLQFRNSLPLSLTTSLSTYTPSDSLNIRTARCTTIQHSFKIKSKMHSQLHSNKHSLPYIVRSHSNELRLRVAASLSNVEELVRLLQCDVDPNSSDDYQRSALHLAASRGYTDIVTQLLKFGAKPNLQDSLGNTPLHLAVCSASSYNFNMVVRILLNYGASVHALDRMGKNPLDLARSKISLMRNRELAKTPESAKMLRDMALLTTLLLCTYSREQESLEAMESLEQRLEGLSTKEVEDEADMLLAKVEQLTLKN